LTRYVVIGAGPAGMRAAEVLRGQAGDADILLIGDEPHPPYDRPPLSKAFLVDSVAPAKLHLKPESFYAEQRIGLRLGTTATKIDRAVKTVTLADGERVAYDKLLIATGCHARRLPALFDAARIHYLRSLADAERLRAALAPGREIILIGGGFIGLELAASATRRGAKVTVLEALPRLMARALPPLVGDYARQLHERHGVRFELDARIQSIARAADGGAVVTTARADYAGDMVLAGIGAAPNTGLAEEAGLAVADGIVVDAQGRTGDPDIFAAGDVTRHLNPLLGRSLRIESWQVALNQAAAVARAMAGGGDAYAELPWLWTDQYDCNIQVLGVIDPAMAMIRRGDAAAPGFTLIGLDGEGRIAAAITVNSGRDMAVLRRLATMRARVPSDALADPAIKLAELLKAARGA
jgi:anthranilate 1,2-dioxygenase ferredoxin reductase component